MQLLQHFKSLTLHPKNAQELKGLILQLAIQGRLTANWRKENLDIEPISELIKNIRKEKTQLIKNKLVKKGKPTQKIAKNEKYLDIPNNWEWVRIIEIGNIYNGDSINKTVKAAKYEGLDEGYPYLGTKDINYGFEELNYDNGVKIPFSESKFKIAHKNTALICSEGGSAGKKCGITTEDICFGNKLYALEQYGNIESVYILSIYKTPIFFEVFQSKMTGIIGGISINSFSEIPIPLPPLEEQKEIVRVVEILFKEVEQLEQLTKERIRLKENFVSSALRQLTTQNTQKEWAYLQNHFKDFFTEKSSIKKLRETVLQLAVQGKLTADWRTCHPELVQGEHHASELLKRIQKEKAQLIKDKKIKKESPLPAITKDEVPYELPDGWVWCRLGDIIKEKPKNGYSPRGVEYETQTKSLKLGATTKGIFDASKVKYLDEIIPTDSHLWLQNNDILIQRSNSLDYVGVSAIYKGEKSEFVYPDLMMKIQSCISIDTTYLHTVLSSESIRQYFRNSASGTSSNMPKINQSIVINTLIPLCYEPEQKAIVEKVNALMGLCDVLEQEIQQNQELNEQLMKRFLREVFN